MKSRKKKQKKQNKTLSLSQSRDLQSRDCKCHFSLKKNQYSADVNGSSSRLLYAMKFVVGKPEMKGVTA